MNGYSPYTQYKTTNIPWLRSIPAHWDIKRIKNIATYNDETLDEKTDPDFEIEYVDISSVSLSTGIKYIETIIFEKAPSRARRKVKDGDVVVSTVRTYLKAITPISSPPENMIVSTGFAVIRPLPNMYSRFAGYLLQCDGFVGDVVANSVGVSYPAINASDLARLPAVEPPIEEQQTIARFLDHKTGQLDALIAKKKALLAKLTEQRTALISEAVTRGLNPNIPMKNSGIAWLGEIPEHWEVTRVKFVAKVGNGSTPKRDNQKYWLDGDFPWLNSSVVNRNFVDSADQFVTDIALRDCHLPIIYPPAVLVGITGQGKTRGMSTKLQIKATLNQHLVYIKPQDNSINVDYLHHLFERAYIYLRNESDAGGSTKGAITCEQIDNLFISLPPIEEQKKIVLHLQKDFSKMSTLRAKVESVLQCLLEYKSTLITNAVTGKIDVRNINLPEAHELKETSHA